MAGSLMSATMRCTAPSVWMGSAMASKALQCPTKGEARITAVIQDESGQNACVDEQHMTRLTTTLSRPSNIVGSRRVRCRRDYVGVGGNGA
jgi:hypothetical protein